jgi:hypothetical protein
MISRTPFCGKSGSSRVIADASLPITIKLVGTDETVRITKLAGSFSIMARIDNGNAAAGTATSTTDGHADTPILVNQSIVLSKGKADCFLSLGVGPDGVSASGWTIVQTGTGGFI